MPVMGDDEGQLVVSDTCAMQDSGVCMQVAVGRLTSLFCCSV
jgi:hypothetical protein